MNRPMINHIESLVLLNKQDGTYQGNKKHWEDMNEQILRWINAYRGERPPIEHI